MKRRHSDINRAEIEHALLLIVGIIGVTVGVGLAIKNLLELLAG